MLKTAVVVCAIVAVSPMATAQGTQPSTAPSPARGVQPDVLCGMRILRADPTSDRKMVHPASRGTTSFSLRVQRPALCRGDLLTPGVQLKQALPQFKGPKP